MNPASDMIAAIILTAFFCALIAAAEVWARKGHPKPEWTRKLVHATGGIVCLAFPFVITRWWVVLALAGGMCLIFTVGSRTHQLRSLDAVERESQGTRYYPLAVFLVFVLSSGRPWLFLSSILVLAVADALAALIGTTYGVLRFDVEDSTKSLEGSAVFLTAAFLSIHLPMLLMTTLPRPTCVLAALLVAILVTGFEAVSLRGSDNLFVPLAVCVILDRITQKPLSEIIFQNLSLLGICGLVAGVVWRSHSFNTGGAITLILFIYGCWSLGSVMWALPILAGVLLFAIMWIDFGNPRIHVKGVRVRTVAHAVLVPFFWLVLANCTGRYAFFYGPFVASLAATLATACWKLILLRTPRIRGRRRILAGTGACTVAGIVTSGVAAILLQAQLQHVLPQLALILGSGLALEAYQNKHRHPGQHGFWRASDFIASASVALALAVLQMLKLVPLWSHTA